VNGYLVVHYDLGSAEERIVETRHERLHDGQYHYVTIIRHGNNVSVQLDELPLRYRLHGLYSVYGITLAAQLSLPGPWYSLRQNSTAAVSSYGLCGTTVERSLVCRSTYSWQPWASCSHACSSVTKQYDLVPADGR